MAFFSTGLGRLRAELDRRGADFDDEVEARLKVAQTQPFCTPLEYARIRATTPGAPPRSITTWREVQARLQRSAPVKPLAEIEQLERDEPVDDQQPDGLRYVVGLLTECGPDSPAAALAALAADGLVKVGVETDELGPTLVYQVPADLDRPEYKSLA